ncbi:MAG: tetratricopeptide repeat protein [Pirellulales bacterium]
MAAYLAGELVRKRGAAARTAAEKLTVEEAAGKADGEVAAQLWDRENIEESELLRYHANWRQRSGRATCQSALEKAALRRALRRRFGWRSLVIRRRRVFKRTVHGIRLRGTRRFLCATESALARLFASSAASLMARNADTIQEQFSGNIAHIRSRVGRGGNISIMWRVMRHEHPDRFLAILVHEATHNEFRNSASPRSETSAVEAEFDEEFACHRRAYDVLVEIGANSVVVAEEAARVEQWSSATRSTKQQVREARAYLAYDRGEYERALALFAEAIELDSYNRELNLGWKAFSLHMLERSAEALCLLEQALEEFPDCDGLYYTRAQIREHLGPLDLALEDWDRATELQPYQPWIERRAALLDRLGRAEAAQANRSAAARVNNCTNATS